MKRLILSRLWMLISIIILTTGQAWAQTASTQKVFTSIKELRDAAQTISDKTLSNVVIQFNEATVVAVMKNADEKIKSTKFVNSFFVVDNSNYGLWISPNDEKGKNLFPEWKLKIGSKITGSIIGDYNEGEKGMPYFGSLINSVSISGTSYTTTLTINPDGEANETKEAVYPFRAVTDVNTIAKNNDADGNTVNASYGEYLNTIIQVPGTIKKGTNNEYYLVQDENTGTGTDFGDKRIYFSCSQLPNINIDDYVGTSGTFEGILIKRNISESKLIVLKGDFFKVSKIYLDENDVEDRVEYLASQGAFDDEVEVYVHRTKLVSNADAWNTICLPFDLTKDEFQKAFGCTLTALAKPTTSDETAQQWAGTVSDKGVLAFTKLADTELTIKAGVPYLMQASGPQTKCLKTFKDSEDMTPDELIGKDGDYYASVGKKTITLNSPYEVKASYNDDIVNGDFYFRGLYGRKKYVDGSTTTLIADGGSQKYQYISTAAGSYLKYLPSGSTLQFNGMRAYFYFPNWNAENNNAAQDASNGTNAKIHVAVMAASTTGISNISAEQTAEQAEVYNLSGQRVDASYKGIVVRNGRKYLRK